MIDTVKYLEVRCSFSEHDQETVKKKIDVLESYVYFVFLVAR